MMINLIQEGIENAFPYENYRSRVTQLIKEGKASGAVQTPDLLQYSILNETRMNRLEKTITIDESIKSRLEKLEKSYIWLVLAEGWCGDAAQILPVIYKMSQINEKINFLVAFRDENEVLMQQFLTNGSRSIPKLICIDAATKTVIGDWGPRPNGAIELIENYKKEHGKVDEPAKIALQKWYLENKGQEIQQEIIALL